MKNTLVISVSILLAFTGCTESNRGVSPGKSPECHRLKQLFNNLREENISNVAFFADDSNAPVDEVGFEEFREVIFELAGCCEGRKHPLSNAWRIYNRLECIWEYLESEKVEKIAFCEILGSEFTKPKDWQPWVQVTEPEDVREVLRLLSEAIKGEKDRFAHEDWVIADIERMQVITDKHKFIVPISRHGNTVCGVGWESGELSEQLSEWSVHDTNKR